MAIIVQRKEGLTNKNTESKYASGSVSLCFAVQIQTGILSMRF